MAALAKVLVCDASCILARGFMILPECADGSASTEEQLHTIMLVPAKKLVGSPDLKHLCALVSPHDFYVFQ